MLTEVGKEAKKYKIIDELVKHCDIHKRILR